MVLYLNTSIITLTLTAYTFASGVFISEYAEGSSYNKYVEIYNGTGATLDLSSYELWKIANGGSWPGYTLALSTTVSAGDVYVICHESSDGFILAECDETWTQANFNGDDAVGLAQAGSLIDAIGTDGDDPGSYFDVCGNGETKDNTIVRNSDVTEGNTNWASASCEYTIYENNTWDYLGSHTCDACGSGNDICEDDSACNTGADGSCEYPDTGYDCNGNCVGQVDCAGECGGSAKVDACGECEGDIIDSENCNNMEIKTIPPQNYTMVNAYPNPFNSNTLITLQTMENTIIKLDIVNLNGRIIDRIHSGYLSRLKTHTFLWDGNENNSGIYFARISQNNKILTHKIILLK